MDQTFAQFHRESWEAGFYLIKDWEWNQYYLFGPSLDTRLRWEFGDLQGVAWFLGVYNSDPVEIYSSFIFQEVALERKV